MRSFREETSRTRIAPPVCVRQRRIDWEVSSQLCASRQESEFIRPAMIHYFTFTQKSATTILPPRLN
jgi:hypothetical protein